MFKESLFNGDISQWDTSNTTNMQQMFFRSKHFNGNISTKSVIIDEKTYVAWNVSKVTNMEQMLRETYSFNQALNSWDVSNVTDIQEAISSLT